MRRTVPAALLAVLLGLGGCGSPDPAIAPAPESGTPSTGPASPTTGSATTGSPSPSAPVASAPATPAPVEAARIRHVVAISVDGLGSEALVHLGREGAPHFYRLIDDGAATLNARNDRERTITLPNHTSMLTGRRVAAARGGHGITFNEDRGGTVARYAGHPVASVFDVVHAAGLRSALFTAKEKFELFDRSWPAIDRFELQTDNARLTDDAIDHLLAERPAFLFLHLSDPDVAGHAHDWMSPRYLAAVRRADANLGRLLAAVDAHPRLARHLVLAVTSDHGGVGHDHSRVTEPRNYTIPFLVDGAGVPAGADLYQLNPGRTDPGRGRPAYAAHGGPIRNGDVANAALAALGLPPVPGSEFGATAPVSVR